MISNVNLEPMLNVARWLVAAAPRSWWLCLAFNRLAGPRTTLVQDNSQQQLEHWTQVLAACCLSTEPPCCLLMWHGSCSTLSTASVDAP